MNDTPLLAPLRQSADPKAVDQIERLIEHAPDRDLNRINALAFATEHSLDPQKTIAAFLHAAQLGLFEMSWNVLCPSCGGVLDANETLKSVDRDRYHCAFCAAGYEPTLDEIVEVTFTVNPRVRRIAAHAPDELPPAEFYRQMFWSSGVDLPDNLQARIEDVTLDLIELPAGEKAFLSLQLPPGVVIIFDPVTHATQFIEAKGEPTHERQNLSMVIGRGLAPNEMLNLRPGPLRLSIENHTARRVLRRACPSHQQNRGCPRALCARYDLAAALARCGALQLRAAPQSIAAALGPVYLRVPVRSGLFPARRVAHSITSSASC